MDINHITNHRSDNVVLDRDPVKPSRFAFSDEKKFGANTPYSDEIVSKNDMKTQNRTITSLFAADICQLHNQRKSPVRNHISVLKYASSTQQKQTLEVKMPCKHF